MIVLDIIILIGYNIEMKQVILSLLVLISACATKPKEKDNGPKCYLFHGNPVVLISSEPLRVYLFSKFIDREFFYYEQRSYLDYKYLPSPCNPEVVARAKFLMENSDE